MTIPTVPDNPEYTQQQSIIRLSVSYLRMLSTIYHFLSLIINLDGIFVLFSDKYNYVTKLARCYDQYLIDATWTRVKSNDNMIGYAAIVSVSALYSRCYILSLSLCLYNSFTSCTIDYFLMAYLYIQHRYIPVFLCFTT